jgi:hypothetical protein
MKKNNSIPALPYMKAVAQFARSKGLRFFTWAEQMNAIQLYESNAARLN